MNNFTKDDLFNLQSCVLLWGINGKKDKEYLNDKIQSMIDNYCEHEFQEDLHHIDICLCVKCGKREWWQNK